VRRPIILAGAGGLAREVAEAVRASADRELLGFVDDDQDLWGTTIDGVRVLGGLGTAIERNDASVVLCAGKGSAREGMANRLQVDGFPAERYTVVMHPSVLVPASCSVGAGSVLLAGTVLTADVTIGQHVVLMPNVTLTHDDVVADCATLCAGVTLGGDVQVGRAAYLGMSSSVRESRTVGDRATLGMGSVLLEDLPAGQTWVGNPAAMLRSGRPSSIASPAS
jgi:sugar O-acyltransferase (sialic acid O-acetyltransferase NeuD family)